MGWLRLYSGCRKYTAFSAKAKHHHITKGVRIRLPGLRQVGCSVGHPQSFSYIRNLMQLELSDKRLKRAPSPEYCDRYQPGKDIDH